MFDERYFGALKVPKQFLGQADEMPGGIGDTTLTQLDIRYARTVKRCQRIIKSGLKDLIYWFCSIHNILPPTFSIEMPRIITAEDTRLSDIQKADIEITSSLIELIKSVDENAFENADKQKLMAALLNKVSNDQELIDSLNLDKLPNGKSDESGGGEQTESDEAPEDEEDMGEPGMDFGM